MRSIVVLSLLTMALLAFPAVPISANDQCAQEVLISRVCASYPGEFISIINHGSPVDLEGWRLSDGEGSVTFNSSIPLQNGESVTFASSGSFFHQLYPDELCLTAGLPSILTKGSLKLADAGDQVFLFDPLGNLCDVLCYGNIEPQAPWSGPPAVLKKGSVLVRTGPGKSPDVWEMAIPGLYTISSGYLPAQVRPLLHPDGAFPELIREVDLSRRSVKLACYILENWTLARHLAGASARGVEVTVLLEGRPVGGVTQNEAAIAYYLQDSGVDVWIMRSGDSFRRYDYLHAKYAVFDGQRLYVSSENMADSSFGSNRGWAAMVDSEELSSMAEGVFDRDLACLGADVFPLDTSLPRSQGGPGRLLVEMPMSPQSYLAEVSILTSPYSIQDLLVRMISSAQKQVIVQQMRIDEAWIESSEIISALYNAANRGVSVRIQLDSGLGTKEGNREVAEDLNRKAMENRWDLECRLTEGMSFSGRLHNKGVIIDDTVMVGSANWVDGSMERNREMAVAIRSETVSDIFRRWFETDWKGDSSPPTIELPWHYLEVAEGEPLVLDATGCHDPSGVSNITWDLDGDGTTDLLGPLHIISLQEGTYNITLLLEDSLGNKAVETVTVMVYKKEKGVLAWLLYVPITLVTAFVLLRRSRRL